MFQCLYLSVVLIVVGIWAATQLLKLYFSNFLQQLCKKTSGVIWLHWDMLSFFVLMGRVAPRLSCVGEGAGVGESEGLAGTTTYKRGQGRGAWGLRMRKCRRERGLETLLAAYCCWLLKCKQESRVKVTSLATHGGRSECIPSQVRPPVCVTVSWLDQWFTGRSQQVDETYIFSKVIYFFRLALITLYRQTKGKYLLLSLWITTESP